MENKCEDYKEDDKEVDQVEKGEVETVLRAENWSYSVHSRKINFLAYNLPFTAVFSNKIKLLHKFKKNSNNNNNEKNMCVIRV